MMRKAAGMALGAVLLGAGAASADTYVYVSVAAEKRIAVYRADARTGDLAHLQDVPTEGEPGALVADPGRRFLFASLRAEGKLSSFRIDPKSGSLAPVNTVPAGPDPAHLSTDRQGRFLLCAYYVDAKVTVHAISAAGELSREPRQTLPTVEKAHAVLLDPKQRFAFVPHTGPNVIYQFTYDGKRGELRPAAVPRLETPPHTGPRHLVFHPSGEIAYVDNEQGGSVTAYRLDRKAGTLRPFQTLSTLPPGFAGSNACAEIRIHPNGRFLYVSNRGHDSLAGFRIAPEEGRLTALAQTPTERTPRSFDLDPSGRFLYAAGESSGKLAGYRVDPSTGALERFATWKVGKQPWWVLAVTLGGD